MQIIDGRQLAQTILAKLKEQVAKLAVQPIFCDVLVGSDPVSVQYVKMKGRLAQQIGMRFRRADFPADIITNDLVAEISKINQEPDLCGLIVQLPLPVHLDRAAALNAIAAKIDVDCTGEINTQKFYAGQPYLVFPTAAAVMAVLDSVNLDLSRKNILVVGQGQLVGRPVTSLLRRRGLRVQTADEFTKNVPALTKRADVLISAAGRPKLITGEMVKSGCVIVDAGTSESDSGIVGDVDFESVRDKASFISPVPGGVGPVTVAMLLQNVLTVAQRLQ